MMPVSGIGRVFHDSAGYITQVWLNSEITTAQANAMTPFVDMTVAQFTAAGINDDAELNTLLGKHIDANTRAVGNYASTGAELRARRRGQINQLVRSALNAVPPVAAGKEDKANGLIHTYIRQVYAASTVDAVIDNDDRYEEMESAGKGGDYAGGLPAWFKLLATSEANSDLFTHATTGWDNALGSTQTVLQSIDSAGAPSAKVAALPTGWASSRSYEPANAL